MPRQAAATGTDPYRGRKIGKYEILTRLSVGGMAELFLAFTSGPGGFRKFVALKQILPDVKTDEFVKMFLDEARITAAFSHANIGQVFELGQEDGELYLAMEFLPGQNLEQVMITASRVRPLPVGFAARVIRDVCLGLHYAHNFTAPSGRKVAVVHRDMAPRNVMVTYDGGVKVIDFGIAKAKGRIARTRVGMVKGTSGYMSPEQVRGQELDGRSDLFTAGVLLHEMLCGQRLFDSDDEDAMMRQIAHVDVHSPRTINPRVPEALDAVVMRALVRDPARRFATGREMAKAIEAACGPELYDEEAVAELMQTLFAEKRLKTLALLDYASRDDERVSEIVGVLREEGADQESSDIEPTAPRVLLPVQQPTPRSGAPRLASPGARPSPRRPVGGEQSGGPTRARPLPARPIPEVSARKGSTSIDNDPTRVGPAPGMPPRASPPESEARESRRSPRGGGFTLGHVEPQEPLEAESGAEDSETSEVSREARLSRAPIEPHRPARRGMGLVIAVMLAGLAMLFVPESLRSRLGALFSSAGQWVSERSSARSEPQAAPAPPAPSAPAKPPPESYEPPAPRADGVSGEAPAEAKADPPASAETAPPRESKPSESPSNAREPAKPGGTATAKPGKTLTKKPLAPVAEPSEEPASPQEKPAKSGRPPAHQGKFERQAPAEPIEEPVEPLEEPVEHIEPSTGPAEIDPSIEPLELSPPSMVEEEGESWLPEGQRGEQARDGRGIRG
jgi:serine/threonine protein kinase